MNCDPEKEFGKIVGKGSQATVYAKGAYAVKLYREGYPKTNVFCEAAMMANLERENFPSPKIYEVLLVNGRYALRMDRVKGKMMSEALEDPASCESTLDALVDLQCRLQKHSQAVWAPDIKLRFRADLENNDRLSAGRKAALLKELDDLPDGNALCHCDFHAGNVFFDGTGYTIIDLLQISRGDPAADAACSYVAYSFLNQEFADFYLKRYCEKSGISEECVRSWLRVYAGTILGQVPERFTPILERFITTAAPNHMREGKCKP